MPRRESIYLMLLAVGVLLLIIATAWPSNKSSVEVVKYDCRMLMGGWHPDVPKSVQDECRKRESK